MAPKKLGTTGPPPLVQTNVLQNEFSNSFVLFCSFELNLTWWQDPDAGGGGSSKVQAHKNKRGEYKEKMQRQGTQPEIQQQDLTKIKERESGPYTVYCGSIETAKTQMQRINCRWKQRRQTVTKKKINRKLKLMTVHKRKNITVKQETSITR